MNLNRRKLFTLGAAVAAAGILGPGLVAETPSAAHPMTDENVEKFLADLKPANTPEYIEDDGVRYARVYINMQDDTHNLPPGTSSRSAGNKSA